MNIRHSIKTPFAKRHRQGGLAVITMLALLSIILVCIAANLKALYRLNREIKLVDQQQVRRLNAITATNTAILTLQMAGTNAPATNNPALPPARE